MMRKILFLADYPNENNIKEGMLQRIKAVDMDFEEYYRIYMRVSLKTNFKFDKKTDGKVTVIRANIVLHFWQIMKVIMSSKYIYVHSIGNFKVLRLFNLRNKVITVDIHGTVPEEQEFTRGVPCKPIHKLESAALKSADNIIHVSDEMNDFYKRKYDFMGTKNNIVKPIFATNVMNNQFDKRDIEHMKNQLRIKTDDVVFIYSGNLQKWQNFDLMIEVIQKMDNPNYKFIILTGEIDLATKKLSALKMDLNRCILRSVLPEELSKYYTIAHYGFILRDDHILNRVSAPTKLIEYLFFGIIPIVKCACIGDSERMGYEYISYTDNINNLLPQKSKKNMEISNELMLKNKTVKLQDIVFGCS